MNFFHELAFASWSFYLSAAIYMLFGFLAAAVLHAVIRPEIIARYLGRGKIKPVIFSALAGIPIPLCSCGVIPAATGLKKSGANNGATLSFMISTPETGVDSIPITYALVDPVMAVIRPISAFFTAVVAGIAENLLPTASSHPQTTVPATAVQCSAGGCGCQTEASLDAGTTPATTRKWHQGLRSGLKFAFEELLGDIGKWFLLGIALAALISVLVPDHFIESYLGHGWGSMLIMMIAGIPMYVCATASTPIAAALMLKGLSPGAALVFLLVGPATNIATLTMVGGFLGRRALAVYLTAIAVCSLVMGGLTNMIYSGFDIPVRALTGTAAEIIPVPVEISAAFVLGVLLVHAVWKSR